MSETPWVETLQPGDKVTVVSGRSGSLSICPVVRATAKQVVVKMRHNEVRFWKRNLEEVGSAGTWARGATICKTTQEHRDRIRRSNLIHAIHNRRDDSKVTLKMAVQIYSILVEGGAIKEGR